MLLILPDVLDADTLSRVRAQLAAADWIDGRATAGHQGAAVKRNRQLPEQSALARALGDAVLAALERNPAFISAALPRRVYPPLFNRYEDGETFGAHVDNAVRLLPGSGDTLRSDLSATLFLSDPASYDGGELRIDEGSTERSIKLPAGHLVLYPASTVHRVMPVTRGVRLASFLWIQSLIRDTGQRELLYRLDEAVQRLRATGADETAVLHVTNTYHNLLRRWSEC